MEPELNTGHHVFSVGIAENCNEFFNTAVFVQDLPNHRRQQEWNSGPEGVREVCEGLRTDPVHQRTHRPAVPGIRQGQVGNHRLRGVSRQNESTLYTLKSGRRHRHGRIKKFETFLAAFKLISGNIRVKHT